MQDHSRDLASHKIDNNARPSKSSCGKKCVGQKSGSVKNRETAGEEILNQQNEDY